LILLFGRSISPSIARTHPLQTYLERGYLLFLVTSCLLTYTPVCFTIYSCSDGGLLSVSIGYGIQVYISKVFGLGCRDVFATAEYLDGYVGRHGSLDCSI